MPVLDSLLRQAVESVREGFGIARIRGVPVEQLNMSGCEEVLLRVAEAFGPRLPMDSSGSLIHRVEAASARDDCGLVRGYRSASALTYHNDACDFIAFFCIRAGLSGGERRIASPAALSSRLAQLHPELATELYRPVRYTQYFDSQSVNPQFGLPLLCFDHGEPLFVVKPGYVRWAEALDEDPFECHEHRVCFEKLLSLAHAPEFRASWKLMPGDLEIFDNFRVLHARNGFAELSKETGRLLLRTWNCDKDAGTLPRIFESAADYRSLVQRRRRRHRGAVAPA